MAIEAVPLAEMNKLPLVLHHASETQITKDDVVISIQNVSKMYPLYAKSSDRLKQSLWHALPGFLRGRPREFYREFWALHDVSFQVKQGETIGLVGRNGSGKSTLLQIIAGTLAPTYGEVRIRGRVAALLELGSGFNPEFTGRENVYLNGAILGFSKEEIDQIFDDIAAFADIGQFLDQPVKLYSSGMMVRLAFAVQAFVPKEVLIVDEALSVGDTAFQRKCMRVLEEFQNSGGVVLLVSHDSQVVNRWCQEAVLLENGKKLIKDRSKLVTDVYQRLLFSNDRQRQTLIEDLGRGVDPLTILGSDTEEKAAAEAPTPSVQPEWSDAAYDPDLSQPIETTYGNRRAEITDVHLLNDRGHRVNIAVCGGRYRWCYRVHFKEDASSVDFGMLLKTMDGLGVFVTSTLHENMVCPFVPTGAVVDITFTLDMNLSPGTYYLNCGVSAFEGNEFVYLHRRVDVAAIRVIAGDERNFEGITYMNHQIDYNVVTGA